MDRIRQDDKVHGEAQHSPSLIPEPTRHPSSTHFTLMSSPKVISVGANPELLWLRHAVLECGIQRLNRDRGE